MAGALAGVKECNLLEEPLEDGGSLDTVPNGFAFTINPYEIKTYKVEK